MLLNKIIDNKRISIVILLIFHFLYRIILLAMDAFPFNSDEAIVGLMGRHILEGENFLYFYGQSYMGSLDAYLVALGFLIIGQKVIAIRFVQIFLYSLSIVFFYLFIESAFQNRKMAFIGSSFFVFPPVNVVLYTTVSLGGYGEALLIGTVCFYLVELLIKNLERDKSKVIVSLISFLLGLGLFVNPISLTLIFSALIYFLFKVHRMKKIPIIKKWFPIFLVFFLVGSLPFWISFVFSNGFSVFQEITGSAVAVENDSPLNKFITHLTSFLLFGPSVIFGLRAPWNVEWIGKLVIPVVVFFWILLFYLLFSQKHLKNNIETLILISVVGLFTLVGFIFTSFGVDPSGRYFLPFIFPIGVIFGYAIVHFRNKVLSTLAIFVIAYQIFGTYISATKEPYITTQFYQPAQVNHKQIDKLINFLEEENELYGFTNYWVSYPLAFLSGEKIITVPMLPYHPDLRFTERDNRISHYNDLILAGKNYFFLTTNNKPLNDLLELKLNQNEIKFKTKVIDDYFIFYDLSRKITPIELGLMNEYK